MQHVEAFSRKAVQKSTDSINASTCSASPILCQYKSKYTVIQLHFLYLSIYNVKRLIKQYC